jgi:hypothetical protein
VAKLVRKPQHHSFSFLACSSRSSASLCSLFSFRRCLKRCDLLSTPLWTLAKISTAMRAVSPFISFSNERRSNESSVHFCSSRACGLGSIHVLQGRGTRLLRSRTTRPRGCGPGTCPRRRLRTRCRRLSSRMTASSAHIMPGLSRRTRWRVVEEAALCMDLCGFGTPLQACR